MGVFFYREGREELKGYDRGWIETTVVVGAASVRP